MKLVELLVKELEKWPEGVTYFVQDSDGEVKAAGESEPREPREPSSSGVWTRISPLDNYNFYLDLCTDWQTSIVTKDVYAKHKTQMKRKVREDFDSEKRYNVNVSGCAEDVKKEVQQAFFDIGYKWWDLGETYQHLDVLVYSNSNRDGIPRLLGWNKRPMENSITVEEFLELVYEPEKKGHIHAELMALYAEDAKTHSEPWKLWQILVTFTDGTKWTNLNSDFFFHPMCEYRRKPKTHTVHGVEIPDLRIEPKLGQGYWYPDASTSALMGWAAVNEYDNFHSHRIANNLCYVQTEAGKQAAIKHSKAWLGIA